VRTNIHAGMGIGFEEYRRLLGDPNFLSDDKVTVLIDLEARKATEIDEAIRERARGFGWND